MKDVLTIIAANMILVIQAMAMLVVAFGTLQAFVTSIRAMFHPATASHRTGSGARRTEKRPPAFGASYAPACSLSG